MVLRIIPACDEENSQNRRKAKVGSRDVLGSSNIPETGIKKVMIFYTV